MIKKREINYFGIVIDENSYKKTFGQNLKFIRRSKGLTQCEVAKLLDVTPSAYARYE